MENNTMDIITTEVDNATDIIGESTSGKGFNAGLATVAALGVIGIIAYGAKKFVEKRRAKLEEDANADCDESDVDGNVICIKEN